MRIRNHSFVFGFSGRSRPRSGTFLFNVFFEGKNSVSFFAKVVSLAYVYVLLVVFNEKKLPTHDLDPDTAKTPDPQHCWEVFNRDKCIFAVFSIFSDF
jgi:hypothetical protein